MAVWTENATKTDESTLDELLATIGTPTESIQAWWTQAIASDDTATMTDLLIYARSLDDYPDYTAFCELWDFEPLQVESGRMYGLYATLRYHLRASLGPHYAEASRLAFEG